MGEIWIYAILSAERIMDQRSLLRTLTIGNDSLLVPYIYQYLAAGKFPAELPITIVRYKEDDGHFHPSSDCFATPRDLYLKRKGQLTYPPITAPLRMTFDCGHFWHGYLENIVYDIGFVEADNIERKITKEIEGSNGSFIGAGTGDLVGVNIPNHGKWLVDIKSMRKDEFEAGANKYTYMKWEAQISCYMDWFQMPQAMILAICKDSPHQLREYKIQKNEGLLEEIYSRWSYTQKCIDENILPEEKYQPEDPLLMNPGDSVLDLVAANIVTKS